MPTLESQTNTSPRHSHSDWSWSPQAPRCPPHPMLTTPPGWLLKVGNILLTFCWQIFDLPGKGSATASSLHIKIKEPRKFQTPSPGSYNPNNADKVGEGGRGDTVSSDCQIIVGDKHHGSSLFLRYKARWLVQWPQPSTQRLQCWWGQGPAVLQSLRQDPGAQQVSHSSTGKLRGRVQSAYYRQSPVGSWDKPSPAKGFNINQAIFVIRPALLKTTWINHHDTPWLWDILLLLTGWRSQGPGPTCQRRSTQRPPLRSTVLVQDTPSMSLKPNMTQLFLWDHFPTETLFQDNPRSKLLQTYLISLSWFIYC